jgi:hypothetical protein
MGVRALEGRRTEASGLSPFQGWKSFGDNVPVVSPPANIRSASGADNFFLKDRFSILDPQSSILDLRSSS